MSEIVEFFSKGSGLVNVPGSPRILNSPPRYVGRTFQPVTTGGARFPATERGLKCDLGKQAERLVAMRLAKRLRRGELYGNEAACRLAGVAYQPFELIGGANVPPLAKPQEQPRKADKAKKD